VATSLGAISSKAFLEEEEVTLKWSLMGDQDISTMRQIDDREEGGTSRLESSVCITYTGSTR
jgi:hypothetical protein